MHFNAELKKLIKTLPRRTVGIYKITSPSGKVYIGQSRCIRVRLLSYNRIDLRYQPILKNSILKHGLSKHVFTIVEKCDLIDLNEKERYWQDFYNVCDKSFGLNCILTSTTEKAAVVSEGTRHRISKKLKGHSKTKEAVDNMTRASPNKIPVFKYSISGVFITKYSSIKEAARIHNINSAHITSCCRGTVKSVRGFLWSYEQVSPKPIKLKETPIDQYSLEGQFIRTYKNIITTSKETNIKASAISNNLHNKSKTSGGFIFKFSTIENI